LIDLTQVTAGVDTFSVVYGQLFRYWIVLDDIIGLTVPKSGVKVTRFFDNTGPNSCADGDATYDGVCEVCHTDTTYHRNNATGDHAHNKGFDCADCHNHLNGFSHTIGTGCEECHGHDPGYGGYTGGAGTFESHSSHTENDSDDQRGPNVGCDTCHNVSKFPRFADNADTLESTTVCDTCHSPFGTYDGVNDSAIGAKNNWTSGVYNGNGLSTGKEKWCAGCHDDSPANSKADGSGISAPEVIGDESGSYDYGTGYGFYKTGHGLGTGSTYPASGGIVPGAGLECGSCHDFAMKHIDGVIRTYDKDSNLGDDDDYQHGYRLKSVGGEVPLVIPRNGICNEIPKVKDTDFRLCFSCHDSGPFTNSDNYNTSFRHSGSPNDYNAHYSHLSVNDICDPGPMFSSDWSFTGWDSRGSCVTCHNVHGSTRLAMVRDGTLINKTPGLRVSYYNPGVSYLCGGPGEHDPTPADVTLPDSTGTVYDANSVICGTCHGSCGFDSLYLRTPYDGFAPVINTVYGAVGSKSLTVKFSEKVYSSMGATGDLLTTDFTFTDVDNSRSIDTISHTAGDDTAFLTLDLILDGADDIGVDTLAAATATSIYDGGNNAMDTTPAVIQGDAGPPSVSNLSPANGDTGVPLNSNITFTLSDSESNIDWSTFSINLAGNKGYSATYTDASPEVSKIGTPEIYDVTVDPDTDFGSEETITIIVNVDDMVGNSLVPPEWSFTTASGGSATLILHPSGLASNPGGYWTVPIADQWDTYLDTNDGDILYVTSNTGSQGAEFFVNMDDPGITGTIQKLTFHVYARYVSGWSPSPPCSSGNINIGYKTGIGTVWKGSTNISGCPYTLVSSAEYTTDSDGGPLSLTDINNLQIAVKRLTSGSYPLRITEVYVEVTYSP
jgi:hypothetical protein